MADVKNYKPYMLPVDDILKAAREQNNWSPPKKWEPVVGEMAQFIIPVKVFRDFGDGMVDIHDDDGNCLKVSKKTLHKPFFEQFNTDYIMKAMKDAVLKVAKELAKANNTVTTLEIKTELRRDYPYYFWTQDIVSKYMDQLAGDGIFTYTDNGTYRIYSLAKVALSTASKIVAKPMPAKAVVTKRRGRQSNANFAKMQLTQGQVLNLAIGGSIDQVEFKNGRVITAAEIRQQKKSAQGYLTPKLHNITKVTSFGITYDVI
jgi:hypothetical protein